jgi:hypothetical protein
MLREIMEQTIGAVDDIKAVEPFERSARVEVRFSEINSAMRAVTDLQGLKFFDRPLMLAFSRGGASESPEKVQPTPPSVPLAKTVFASSSSAPRSTLLVRPIGPTCPAHSRCAFYSVSFTRICRRLTFQETTRLKQLGLATLRLFVRACKQTLPA